MAEETPKGEDPKKLQDEKLKTYERFLDKWLKLYDEHQTSSSRTQVFSTVGGFLAVAITLGVGGAGIIADAYMKNQDRDDQTFRQAVQKKFQIIAQVSNEITAMREIQEITLLNCKNPRAPHDPFKNREERLKKEVKLTQALRPVYHLFDDKLRAMIIDFVSWESAIADYCDKNAPPESMWRQKQKEIEEFMLQSPIEKFFDI